MAAKICIEKGLLPRALVGTQHIASLQQELLKIGQHIPNLRLQDAEDLVQKATISASSELVLEELLPSGEPRRLEFSVAQMLPLAKVADVPAAKFKTHFYSPLRRCTYRTGNRAADFK